MSLTPSSTLKRALDTKKHKQFEKISEGGLFHPHTPRETQKKRWQEVECAVGVSQVSERPNIVESGERRGHSVGPKSQPNPMG